MKRNLLVFASMALISSLWGGYGYCDACTTNNDCQAGFRCANNECIPSPCASFSGYSTCENGDLVYCSHGIEISRVICQYDFFGRNSIRDLYGKVCVKESDIRAKCGCNSDSDCNTNFKFDSYICDSKHECKSYKVGILAPDKGMDVNCESIKAVPANKDITTCSGNFNLTDEAGTQYTLKTSSSNTGFFNLSSSSDYIQLSNLRPGAVLDIVWGLDGDNLTEDAFENNYIVVSNGIDTREYIVLGSGTTIKSFPNWLSETITIKKGGNGNIKVGIKNLSYRGKAFRSKKSPQHSKVY